MELVELEDTEWFPDVLRDQQLEYIGWLVGLIDIYSPISALLPQWLKTSNPSKVMDLCSGSGEPMISLSKSFSVKVSLTLSDKFPPIHSSLSSNYLSSSTDVLHLDFESDIYYTMFNAFHHFDDTSQRNIVKKLVDAQAAFCIIEILEPSLFALLKVIFANTIGQLLLAPFVRPFSLKRLLFTYIIPVNLLTTTYDGIISVLKSKTKSQYQTLLSSISADNYCIEVESYRAPLFNRLVVIRGFPKQAINL